MKKISKFLKDNYKVIFLLLLFLFFFSFPVLILYDSAHYMSFVEILEGKIPFLNWDIVRGPVFPLIIYLSNALFGKTVLGLLILTFLFYLLMILVANKIIESISAKQPKLRVLLYFVFFIAVIINPIVFGYYHSLLTEFIAMTVSLVSCFLSWKLLYYSNMSTKSDKVILFLIASYFILMTPFAWFLKQPYVTVALFPLIITMILKMVTFKGLKGKLVVAFITFLSILSLVFSINIWNTFLKSRGVNLNSDRNVVNNLGKQILEVFVDFPTSEDSEDYNIEMLNLDDGREELLEIDLDQNGGISTKFAMKFIIKAFTLYPGQVIDSYITNYLGLINIYKSGSADGVAYSVKEKGFDALGCVENCAIAISILNEKSNIYYLPEEMYLKVQNYEQYIDTPFLFRSILGINRVPSMIIFNLSFFFLPFILVIQIVYLLLKKKSLSDLKKNILLLSIILLSYSFSHLLVHTVTGAIIDRYASPCFITTILGYLCICALFWKK